MFLPPSPLPEKERETIFGILIFTYRSMNSDAKIRFVKKMTDCLVTTANANLSNTKRRKRS